MIGYILMGLGAYLVADDYIKSKGVKHEKLSQDVNGSGGGDTIGKSHTSDKELSRNGVIKPFPVQSTTKTADKQTKGGQVNEFHQESVPEIPANQDRDRAGDDSTGKQNTTPVSRKTKSVNKPKLESATQTADKKGGQNAGNEINIENGTGNDGNDVGAQSSSRHESHSTETD